MKRHQYMLDLLRPGLDIEEQIDFMGRKHELTVEDLDQIISSAMAIQRAAEITRSHRKHNTRNLRRT